MDQLEITLRNTVQDIPVLHIHGEIDINSSSKLDTAIRGLMEQGHLHLVLELSGVDYLDSSGIGVMVSCLRRLQESHGTIRIASPGENVQRVLEITKIDRILPVYPDEQQAVQAIMAG